MSSSSASVYGLASAGCALASSAEAAPAIPITVRRNIAAIEYHAFPRHDHPLRPAFPTLSDELTDPAAHGSVRTWPTLIPLVPRASRRCNWSYLVSPTPTARS